MQSQYLFIYFSSIISTRKKSCKWRHNFRKIFQRYEVKFFSFLKKNISRLWKCTSLEHDVIDIIENIFRCNKNIYVFIYFYFSICFNAQYSLTCSHCRVIYFLIDLYFLNTFVYHTNSMLDKNNSNCLHYWTHTEAEILWDFILSCFIKNGKHIKYFKMSHRHIIHY